MSDEKYLQFQSAKEAQARSRDAWIEKLGRPKRPEDVTEFMWQVFEHPYDGTAMLDVSTDEKSLKPAEVSAVQTKQVVMEQGFFTAPTQEKKTK